MRSENPNTKLNTMFVLSWRPFLGEITYAESLYSMPIYDTFSSPRLRHKQLDIPLNPDSLRNAFLVLDPSPGYIPMQTDRRRAASFRPSSLVRLQTVRRPIDCKSFLVPVVELDIPANEVQASTDL